MLLIDKNWSLQIAFEVINNAYYPGGLQSGPQRNRQIETWGQLVGRTRAIAELNLIIDEYGSINKLSKSVKMSSKTIMSLRVFFESLPEDKGIGKIHQGMTIGGYFLIRKIGSGGNANVWRVRSTDKSHYAMKIMKRPKGKPLERFKAEIKIVQSLTIQNGVLPILNSFDEVALGDFAWFVMPIAVPLLNKVNDETSYLEIFECLTQLSSTLVELHGKRIFHRDIKPDNLFYYNNYWCLGDFGIASYPNKQSLTSSHKKLGPLHFIAPEMLQHPDTAHGDKADVYSFAKTIWVLLTGQKFAPPGEQRCDVPQMSLSTWCDMKNMDEIDRLIEVCTKHNPEERPNMWQVRDTVEKFFKELQRAKAA